MSASGQPLPGDPRTIPEALDAAARSAAGVHFFSSRGEPEVSLGYGELRSRAIACALGLLTLGLERGSRVAIIADTSPGFLALFYGCQYAGLIPCPLPFITYVGGRDAYIARIAQLSLAARARLICAPDTLGDIARVAGERASIPVLGFGELPAAGGAGELTPLGSDELAYVQFSSGSTALPKGVPITQAAVANHARIVLEHGMNLGAADRAFSWLPLYHDMGLFGFSIAPLFGCCTVDYLAPSSFARRPNLWTALMSRQGSTITYAPSFGYRLAVQRFAGEALDLSRLRVAGIGGDMIRADVLHAFAECFAGAGFSRSAFVPSYGMAEATLAISFARGVSIDRVTSASLAIGRAVTSAAGDPASGARDFVVCGAVIPEHDLVIADHDGAPLPDHHVGRILVRGPSIMSGYDTDAAATAAVMSADGFMDTGDLGYLADGQLVVTGRSKDVMHYRGRNIWPEDIEWVAERVEPLRHGDVAAIAICDEGEEDRLVCLVQCHVLEPKERDELRRRIVAAISEAAGIACEVVLVPPKSLPFTSSGKLARQAARAAYLAGEMTPASAPAP